MGEPSPPPSKRIKFSASEMLDLCKEDLVKKLLKQRDYLEQLESKLNCREEEDTDEKEKSHLSDSSRRENILVMRLASKEQEMQDYVAQIGCIKKAQEDSAILCLRQANLDPGVNLLFGKMREELQQTKDKLEQAQSELSAWKFTPDSQNGKKLIARCRTLILENQELGRQLSQGKSAQLEAELALQKKFSEDLKRSHDEMNSFVLQLDEEVDGMQSTIKVLQQELAASKQKCEEYKDMAIRYENMLNVQNEVYEESHFNSEPEYGLQRVTSPERNSATNSDCESELAIHGIPVSNIARDKKTQSHEQACSSGNDRHCVTNGKHVKMRQKHALIVTEALINSPGTPTVGSMLPVPDELIGDNSPGTPTQDNMDYSDTSNSWHRSQDSCDTWDDRTNVDCTLSRDQDMHVALSVESTEEDSDDIKVHISAISPKRENCNNKNLGMNQIFPKETKDLKTKSTKFLTSFKSTENSTQNTVNVTDLKLELKDTNASISVDKNMLESVYDKTISKSNGACTLLQPPDMKSHEFVAHENALLKTQVMVGKGYVSLPEKERLATPCSKSTLNDHALGLTQQNGIEGAAFIEKSE